MGKVEAEGVLLVSFFFALIFSLADVGYRLAMKGFAIRGSIPTDTPKPQEKSGKLVNDGWRGYRVGDVWRVGYMSPVFPFAQEQGLTTSHHHLKRFPRSIASEYLRCTTPVGARDVKCMTEAFDKVCHSKGKGDMSNEIEMKGTSLKIDEVMNEDGSLKPKTAVVHMRIGDVIGKASGVLSSKMTKMEDTVYGKVCSQMVKDGIDKAILVGGIHKTKGQGGEVDENESIKYLDKVMTMCKKKGVRSLLVSNDPDSDLCLFGQAEYFVSQPKSGYSQIAQAVVRKRGHKVLPATLETYYRKDDVLESEKHEVWMMQYLGYVLVAAAIILLIMSRFVPCKKSNWGGYRTLFFVVSSISFLLLFLVPLIMPREDRDYGNFLGATFSRRLEDTNAIYLFICIPFFLIGFTGWAYTTFNKDLRVPAIVFMLVAAYLYGKCSMYNKIVHTVAPLLVAGFFWAYMATTTGQPMNALKWLLVMAGPILLLGFINKLVNRGETSEDFVVPDWAWWIYYSSQVWFTLVFLFWMTVHYQKSV